MVDRGGTLIVARLTQRVSLFIHVCGRVLSQTAHSDKSQIFVEPGDGAFEDIFGVFGLADGVAFAGVDD